MKIVILEDEYITAEELAFYINKINPEVEIVAKCESVEEAIAYFTENGCPDLIFSDIQLADGLSFEVYSQVHITCPIVFCTAYDEYAIQAFNTNSIDYILKPFDQKAIEKSLVKYQNFKQYFNRSNPEVLDEKIKSLVSEIHKKSKKNTILVNYRGKFFPISTKEVDFFYTQNEIVWLYKTNGEKFAVNHTLDEIEGFLEETDFYRANRQFIIHKTAIKEFEPYFNRRLLVKLHQETPESITISKEKAASFTKWMES